MEGMEGREGREKEEKDGKCMANAWQIDGKWMAKIMANKKKL